VTQLCITDERGAELAVSPVVEAMIRVLIQSDDAICQNSEGLVELHYVRPRTSRGTAKVSGKLKSHLALERIRGEPATLTVE
jgi:hypothetical protein